MDRIFEHRNLSEREAEEVAERLNKKGDLSNIRRVIGSGGYYVTADIEVEGMKGEVQIHGLEK